MTVDFKARLISGLKDLHLDLPVHSVERLDVYYTELVKWSKKINLIAKDTSAEQIIENHFLDSLTLLPFLAGHGTHLLDIGTGAGFPGLACKAAWPEMAVTLVEPRVKRVSFLGHIVRTLGLRDVTILTCRIEDEAQLPSERAFTHITGRAVTEIGPFLRMVERFAPAGPQVICMKGPRWREELAAAVDLMRTSPFKLGPVVDHVLPFSGAKRSLVVFTSQ
ncbi:MAG: 16S rRNA (guanine(527)-N(7))-methyltransferase RsmG [Desulforhopalus sp.]|nr:16S rRNA (guanine(527)-N(7))-methyltransferase RsmG [Desulforhopalus sp.]